MAQPNHVYEDFEPTTEWQQDAEYDTLLVYLPGFKKEQLKVQVTSAQNIKVFGERPLGNNKFSRFRKELRIPLNYDSNKITAKFEGGVLKIKHPKSTRPETKPQENANSSAEKQQLHQKPANEVKDQKNGQEQAAQEVPQKNKIENEKKTNGNINSVNENAASEKDKELKDASGKKNITAATDANDVSGKSSNNEKTGGLAEAGKIVSNQHGKGQEVAGCGESKLVYCKQIFGGLVTEMKKPRKSTNMVVAAGLLVLLLGFYVKSAMKSGESEN